MGLHFDNSETRKVADREAALFAALPDFLAEATAAAPGLGQWLDGIDLYRVNSSAALAKLPVLRKPELMQFQADEPALRWLCRSTRPETRDASFSRPARSGSRKGWASIRFQAPGRSIAAGIRAGDIVHNCFAYHMTPGGFVIDEGARALGCTGFSGRHRQHRHAGGCRGRAESRRSTAGTPDFLKVILDRAAELGKDVSSYRIGAGLRRGAVSVAARGVSAARHHRCCRLTPPPTSASSPTKAQARTVSHNPGMIVNESIIVEIVRPGHRRSRCRTARSAKLSSRASTRPIRWSGSAPATFPLSCPAQSPCGRTNFRIKGWLGRADQRTKVKGMFVDPKQVAEILKRHPEISRARLVVTRDGEQDAMKLLAVPASGARPDAKAIEASLARRNETWRYGRVGRRCSSAERWQGDCRRPGLFEIDGDGGLYA